MIETTFEIASESWEPNSGYGNHRIVVESGKHDYVSVSVPWRRRDLSPELIGIKAVSMGTGEEITDVHILKATREAGEIVFRAPCEGRYAIYYMPFSIEGPSWASPVVRYFRPDQMTPSEHWLRNMPKTPAKAKLLKIESRNEFESFYPMEVPMTASESSIFYAEHAKKPFVAVIEDRRRPVRMFNELPAIWKDRDRLNELSDTAYSNEYYVFQTVLCAAEKLTKLSLRFFDKTGAELTDSCTCFTLEGTDCFGNKLRHEPEVNPGEIFPLWCGIDLEQVKGERLELTVLVETAEGSDRVSLRLDIVPEQLPNKGCDDLWRLSRLFWLNSGIGMDDGVAAGYSDVDISGSTVSCLGRSVTFAKGGLPQNIRSYFTRDCCGVGDQFTDVLCAPVELRLDVNSRNITWKCADALIERKGSGSVLVSGSCCNNYLDAEIRTVMEYDGHLDTIISLTPKKDFSGSLSLCVPYSREASEYMVGLGRSGGFRPAKWFYRWDKSRANNTCWLGAPHAGAQIKIKHTEDVWEIYSYAKTGLPKLWNNDGNGEIALEEKDSGVIFQGKTGTYSFHKGVAETLRFSLLITPLKPIAYQQHFTDRYHHVDTWKDPCPSLDEAKSGGASVVNLHQGGKLNAYINYPFLIPGALKEQTQKAHEMGLKYKLYYTVRELSTHAAELWALRTLGDEVLRNGPGFQLADHFLEDKASKVTGAPWLCEHLLEGFVPAWQQILADKDYDASIALAGISRWHNHYLEGLSYLIKELGFDGIYLDGVGYDRQIMKRVRKVMDLAKPGCLIDFHSGNNYEPRYGLSSPISSYLELMPSVDSLWMGEGYDYDNRSYDYWLTEISGIPFGLMGDMLQRGGNRWRGMVFGMTPRLGWQQGGNPVPIWQFWDQYRLKDMQMLGWWNKDCPAVCQNNEIKATVYLGSEHSIIAVASWYPADTKTELTLDTKALGLPEHYRLHAPHIEEYQQEVFFERGANIPFTAKQGYIFLVESH
ncbi:MAG: DUF6067 family protein [Kiritimatiellae bacterium]|nr:DUF6067 family protein [Kiritimatiellia bacterium]